MYGYIDNMVPGQTESVEIIINGKGKITDIPVYEATVKRKTFCVRRSKKIVQIFDNWILTEKNVFIPLERSVKSIGVCQKADGSNKQNMDNRFAKGGFYH